MKSILLLYKNEGLSVLFEKELRKMGYEVTSFYEHPLNYHDFKITDILEKKFRGVVLRDAKFIHRLHDRVFFRYNKKRRDGLSKLSKKYDYCLAIRADLIPENTLQWARSVSEKMVDYQPDGLSVQNKLEDYKKYFDSVFLFDPADVVRYPELHAQPITNFFTINEEKYEEKFDFFYIGSLANDRLKILENLHNYFKNQFSANFILGVSPYDSRENTDAVKFIRSHTSYDENLKMVQESKCLIDLKRPEHDGLSFRFFEAMNFGKKVITDNASVQSYDFYHPNNILITRDFKNYDEISAFMSKPIHEIPEKIKSQYEFKNWANRLLNS